RIISRLCYSCLHDLCSSKSQQMHTLWYLTLPRSREQEKFLTYQGEQTNKQTNKQTNTQTQTQTQTQTHTHVTSRRCQSDVNENEHCECLRSKFLYLHYKISVQQRM